MTYFQEHAGQQQILYKAALRLVGDLHKAKVPILSGTDASNPYVYPGFGIHDELNLLVDAGLSPLEALQAATRNPARFLGAESEFGAIEVGKRADLVLLLADPLKDIRNTKRIESVFVAGRYFSRSDLDQLLGRADTTKPPK